jgi:hypothetical protein
VHLPGNLAPLKQQQLAVFIEGAVLYQVASQLFSVRSFQQIKHLVVRQLLSQLRLFDQCAGQQLVCLSVVSLDPEAQLERVQLLIGVKQVFVPLELG